MKKHDLLQLAKFAMVGTFNTLIDYGLFYVLVALCNWNKNPAQIVAVSVAMTNSYFMNKYWTFEKTDSVSGSEVWRFIVVTLLSLTTTLLCLNLFHDVFRVHEAVNKVLTSRGYSLILTGDHEVMFCKLVSMPFSWVVNFFGNKFWVFGKKTEKNVG